MFTVLQSGKDLKLPTRWSVSEKHECLRVSEDGRDLTCFEPDLSDDEGASARADIAIPPDNGTFYYEIKILDKGQAGEIAIGLSGSDVVLSRLPGWEKKSWGYHGDDGRYFSVHEFGKPFGPQFTTGDVVGCGVNFHDMVLSLFFTKNGAFVNRAMVSVESGAPIFPFVGLRSAGESVRANFGQEPFLFDLEEYRKGAMDHDIGAEPIEYDSDVERQADAVQTRTSALQVH